MNQRIIQKVITAYEKDRDLLCDRSDLENTLGNDEKYLFEVLGLTKSDLIRLEREGLAMKARYSTANKTKRMFKRAKIVHNEGEKPRIDFDSLPVTGPHRIRWIIFKEVLGAPEVEHGR